MTAEVEYAAWMFDSAPGAGLTIVPAGNRYQAERRVRHYQALSLTRRTYGISAKVVRRFTFMPDIDWEDA